MTPEELEVILDNIEIVGKMPSMPSANGVTLFKLTPESLDCIPEQWKTREG